MENVFSLSLEMQKAIQQKICEADEEIIADRHDLAISFAERLFWQKAGLPIEDEEIDLAFQEYDLALAEMYQDMITGAFWSGVHFAVYDMAKGEKFPFDLDSLEPAQILIGVIGD